MRKSLTLLILMVISTFVAFSQDDSRLDAPLGLRIKRNGQDYLIYADKNLSPNLDDYRKINYQVYFRKVDVPVIEYQKKMYQLISIPGSHKEQDQSNIKALINDIAFYPRSGRTVDKEDYDQNFWIEVEIIEKNVETEHYKYANDVFSGLLTAPFKWRLKLGNAPESLIDGDFNIAPFIGWKWRLSSVRPFYIAPFGFGGITTLKYNSANNTEITSIDKLENGTGLTYGAGLSFKFGNVSPGFIVGWDKGFGNMGSGFLYNDKAWISFSINYDFFKPNQTSEGKQK